MKSHNTRSRGGQRSTWSQVAVFGTSLAALVLSLSRADGFGDGVYPKTCNPSKMQPALLKDPENPVGAAVVIHGTVERVLPPAVADRDVIPDPDESAFAIITVDQVIQGSVPTKVILNSAGTCSGPLRVGQSGFVAGALHYRAPGEKSIDGTKGLPVLLQAPDLSRFIEHSN